MVSAAKAIDQLRVFPRILMLSVYAAVFWYIYTITIAYLGAPEKTMEFTAFVSVTIPAVVGIATNLTNKYFETGTKWDT